MEFVYPIILANAGVLTYGGVAISIVVTLVCFHIVRRHHHRIALKLTVWMVVAVYLGPFMLTLPIAADGDLPGLPAGVILLCIIHLYLVERLWTRKTAGDLVLHVAAVRGIPESITVLLNAGVDIETRDKNGWTPLHVAAGHGTPEVVTVLLDAGADVKAQTIDGQTVVDLAKSNNKMTGTEAYRRLTEGALH